MQEGLKDYYKASSKRPSRAYFILFYIDLPLRQNTLHHPKQYNRFNP